ncbi:conserved protein of unknown function [Rhodovastum atsumiense]|uniref:Uncharacterized protein n=1 Tax=Rhodovastum atsumiense TaxID=504468 RepID=A0A5M6IM05_9PROT|nr:hypothetical protein [Rhodovastum atsumiense]KAA5608899.1 hypothetical protein F1189_26955 [Rhodovastum atsumiense]CAH2602291.1 conserved protein of unknown function [Rhodovastum atsumiense]
MENLVIISMLLGYVWGVAGIVAWPGVSWKPGAAVVVGAAAWLIAHEAMPPEPAVEAAAILIFLVVMFARERLHPFPTERRKPSKAPEAD